MNPVHFNREDELPSSGSATARGTSETNVTKGQNTVKVRPFFIVALTVGLCFVATELVATDCRSAFEDLKAKIRRTKTIACAEKEYAKEISAAKRKYEEALGRAAELRQADKEDRKAERLVNAEGDNREASADAAGIHRILVEEAAASYRQAQEDAQKSGTKRSSDTGSKVSSLTAPASLRCSLAENDGSSTHGSMPTRTYCPWPTPKSNSAR